jgi:hypothetical protein
LAVSVLPTPVGPRKRNVPIGFFLFPARINDCLTAKAIFEMASS